MHRDLFIMSWASPSGWKAFGMFGEWAGSLQVVVITEDTHPGCGGPGGSSGLYLLKGLLYSLVSFFLFFSEPSFSPFSLCFTSLCRSLWWRIGKPSFCTLLMSAQAQAASQSMCCGGRSGMQRALGWLWRALTTSSWRTSTRPPVSSSSPTMVGTLSKEGARRSEGQPTCGASDQSSCYLHAVCSFLDLLAWGSQSL